MKNSFSLIDCGPQEVLHGAHIILTQVTITWHLEPSTNGCPASTTATTPLPISSPLCFVLASGLPGSVHVLMKGGGQGFQT